MGSIAFPPDPVKRKRGRPRLSAPTGRWATVDWSLRNFTIARLLGVSTTRVEAVRARFGIPKPHKRGPRPSDVTSHNWRDFTTVGGPKGDCLEWRFRRQRDGYGRIGNDGTHRFIYRLLKGPIPRGLLVCHSCDNPPCINPDHLFVGTTLDNMRDRDAKGRGRYGRNRP